MGKERYGWQQQSWPILEENLTVADYVYNLWAAKEFFKGNFVYTCLPSTLILEPNYTKKMHVVLFF